MSRLKNEQDAEKAEARRLLQEFVENALDAIPQGEGVKAVTALVILDTDKALHDGVLVSGTASPHSLIAGLQEGMRRLLDILLGPDGGDGEGGTAPTVH